MIHRIRGWKFFVPGLVERESVKRVCAEAGLPVNVLAFPGLPAPDELASLGAHVVVGARRSEPLEDTASEIASAAQRPLLSPCVHQGARGLAVAGQRLYSLYIVA